MRHAPYFACSRLLLAVVCAAPVVAQHKRPIDHEDYDKWPAIRSVAYSPDGKWIAYSVDPADGDGVLYVREVDGTKVIEHPRGSGPQFSADGKKVIFAVLDSKEEAYKKKLDQLFAEETEKLEAEARKSEAEAAAEEARRRAELTTRFSRGRRGPGGRGGRGGGGGGAGSGKMAVLDIATGKVEVVDKTRSFRVLKDGAILAYHLPAPEPKEPEAGKPQTTESGAAEPGAAKPGAGGAGGEGRRTRGAGGQRTRGSGGRGGRPGAGRRRGGGGFPGRGTGGGGGGAGPEGGPADRNAGTALVLRDLASGVETRFEGVSGFQTVAEDAWMLLTLAAPAEAAAKTGEAAGEAAGGTPKPAAAAQAPKVQSGLLAVRLGDGHQVRLIDGEAAFGGFTVDRHKKKLAFTSDIADKRAAAAKKAAAEAAAKKTAAEAAAKKTAAEAAAKQAAAEGEAEKAVAQAEAKPGTAAKEAGAAGKEAGTAAKEAGTAAKEVGAAGKKPGAGAKPAAGGPTGPRARGGRGGAAATPRSGAAEAPPARSEIFLWEFDDAAPRRLVGQDTSGMPKGARVQASGLSFSADGSVLTFGIKGEDRPEPPKILPEEKVVVDIWHWNDGQVQSQQAKSRQGGAPTLTCAWHLGEDRMVVLGDEAIPSVRLLTTDGSRALATDDKPYEKLVTWDGRYTDVYVVNTINGERKKVLTRYRGRTESSPSGRYLLYFGQDYEWYSIDIETGAQSCLTAGLDVAFENELEDRPQPASAHGIVGFTKGDKAVLVNDRYDIWKIDLRTRAATCVTDGYGRANHIVLRYTGFDLEGDDDQRDPDERAYLPETLVLSALHDTTKASGYYTDTLSGVARPKKLLMLDRAFGSLTRAKKAERLFFTLSSFAEFPDVWVADLDFGNRRKLTEACAIQSEVRWGNAELVNWTNDDGVPLQGILVKPDGFDPKQKYPMMVYFYERNANTLHRYTRPSAGTSPNAAYYVSNGYLWFVPDIVYTVGYPGESAEKCIISGVQHLLAQGFVDRGAIGMAGHSWGGYQTAHLVTRTNLFAAAESGAPVSNMFSAYGGIRYQTGMSRQFQYERTQSRIGGTPWEYPQRYWQNSPLFYADRVTTPVLILHNDEDGAVPWTNGLEYFMALRRLGKEAYLFNYNGEAHGLRKKQNQVDWTRRMAEFFDHHLRGKPAPRWMAQGVKFADREREKVQYAPSFQERQRRAAAGSTQQAQGGANQGGHQDR